MFNLNHIVVLYNKKVERLAGLHFIHSLHLIHRRLAAFLDPRSTTFGVQTMTLGSPQVQRFV